MEFENIKEALFLISAPIETPNSVDYTWLPAGPEGIVFRVRAANDAHIALTSSEGLSNPMIEVFIGGWANSKSVIRKDQTKPDVFETPTPMVLDANEFRGFWIRWSNNYITVGRENEAAPFMSYSNPDSYPINYVGIRTRRGASGSWIIEEP
ncbi:CLUMA_CG013685, isoform A [Clunio marinus]|uniref:CLUMA_CG013685, isoform A n=1 Tax=Clunio marinus TaxID=568069 RepID=A0A1J1IJK8_9DIPT|nr:CLUMA_CG013685, isoform A [Clunio marinus]